MNTRIDVTNDIIDVCERLLKILKKIRSKQIEAADDKNKFRAFAIAFIKKYKELLLDEATSKHLETLGKGFDEILKLTNIRATKRKYEECLVGIRTTAQAMRTVYMTEMPKEKINIHPNFSNLIKDQKMEKILDRRWQEVEICIGAHASLSSLVMMGGLLEAVILTKIMSLELEKRSTLFKLSVAPRDEEGKTIQLKDWYLKDFLEIAHASGWISQTAKDVADVVRDYRNYIHPQKEYSHGIEISIDDAQVMWGIVNGILQQLLKK